MAWRPTRPRGAFLSALIACALCLASLSLSSCKSPAAGHSKAKVLIMLGGGGVNPSQFTGNPWGGAGIGSMWNWSCEGLFQFTRMTDNISNRLAESVTHHDNRTIVTLRPAVWNDGVPVTAKDVWAFYQMHDVGVLYYVTAINVLDDRTIEYVWREPAPYEQFRMCMIAPDKQLTLPYHIYKRWIDRATEIRKIPPLLSQVDIDKGKKGPFSRDTSLPDYQKQWSENWRDFKKAEPAGRMPVLTGPFNFYRLTENQMLLQKNPRYWAADKIKFDYVKLVAATPEQSIATLKNSGAAQLDGSLPLDIAQAVIRKNKDAVFYPTIDPACHGFYLNQQSKNAPLARKEFRKALNFIIRKTPIREAGNYYGQEFEYSTTAIAPGYVKKYVSPDVVARMERYTYNPARAESLLNAIGCRKAGPWWVDASGAPIKLALGVNGGWIPAGVVANVATLVADQMKAFGLQAEVSVVDGSVFWDRMRAGNFDLTFDWLDVSWSFTYPYFPLRDYYTGTMWRGAMKVPEDPATGNPLWDVVDWDGKKVDPCKVIQAMPRMLDEKERQYWIDRLVWIANENAFAINLYQNVTGEWYNRGLVKNLPLEDRIDEFHQMMPIPQGGDVLQKTAELNPGFGGCSLLFWLEPR
jgi:peptide/nickel transport system substrate-binding protein